MSVHVKFFAGLRERVGHDEAEVTATPGMTVATVWRTLLPETEMPANTLAAVNMEYTGFDAPVADDDEVAFFPPVTGG